MEIIKNNKNFRFFNFKVYNDAKNFYHDIVIITAKFPRQYWELGDQMRRSSLSVILNIAEGSAKKSDNDFNRYIKISLGSMNECIAGMDVAYSEKLISDQVYERIFDRGLQIANQLGGFSKSLK